MVQPEEITPGLAGDLRVDLPGVQRRLRPARAHARGPPDQARGQPRAPDQPRHALRARPGRRSAAPTTPIATSGPLKRGATAQLAPIAWDEAIAELAAAVGARRPPRRGARRRRSGRRSAACSTRGSPATGGGTRVEYEPFAPEALRDATAGACSASRAVPIFDLADADFVIDFGSDCLETGPSPVEHARQIAAARDVAQDAGRAARLVYVGPRLDETASHADEWIAGEARHRGHPRARDRARRGRGRGARAARSASPRRRSRASSPASAPTPWPRRPTCPPTTIRRIGARARAGEAPGRAAAGRRAHEPRAPSPPPPRCCS